MCVNSTVGVKCLLIISEKLYYELTWMPWWLFINSWCSSLCTVFTTVLVSMNILSPISSVSYSSFCINLQYLFITVLFFSDLLNGCFCCLSPLNLTDTWFTWFLLNWLFDLLTWVLTITRSAALNITL